MQFEFETTVKSPQSSIEIKLLSLILDVEFGVSMHFHP